MGFSTLGYVNQYQETRSNRRFRDTQHVYQRQPKRHEGLSWSQLKHGR